MNSVDDKKVATALTKLLRAELRHGRFSLANLALADTRFVPNEHGGVTSSNIEETSKEELDARGLKTLHQRGDWRQDSSRYDVRVRAVFSNSESAARLEEFERLLNDFGVLSEGCIAHPLGSIISTCHNSTVGSADFPVKSIGVSATAGVWSYLLVDACLTTPRRTANKLLRWVRGAPLTFETRVLLGRLNAASSFALANGLAVVRLPRRKDSLEGWFATGSGVALTDYLDRTMLCIPCRISPVLSKPTRVTQLRDGTPGESWDISDDIEATWPLPLGGVHQLARALSLVCDVEVETPRIWPDYGVHAHFGQQLSRAWYGSGDLPNRTVTESPLTVDRMKEAIRLQPKLRNISDSVETALRYWLKSKSRGSELADRLVFLRTALEALFLDSGSRAELTFRLSTNGAWYTGRNPAERRQRYNTLKDVYSAASGAVHSGRVKSTAERLLTDGQEICRLAILKRLRSRQDPVWEDIVFGR